MLQIFIEPHPRSFLFHCTPFKGLLHPVSVCCQSSELRCVQEDLFQPSRTVYCVLPAAGVFPLLLASVWQRHLVFGMSWLGIGCLVFGIGGGLVTGRLICWASVFWCFRSKPKTFYRSSEFYCHPPGSSQAQMELGHRHTPFAYTAYWSYAWMAGTIHTTFSSTRSPHPRTVARLVSCCGAVRQRSF